MSNIARQYGLEVKSFDPKLKRKEVVVPVRVEKQSVAGKPDTRVALLEAELDAAVSEIERLRRELAVARGDRPVKKKRVLGEEKPWEKEGIKRSTYYWRLKHQGGE